MKINFLIVVDIPNSAINSFFNPSTGGIISKHMSKKGHFMD
jgi:hypothetical protein